MESIIKITDTRVSTPKFLRETDEGIEARLCDGHNGYNQRIWLETTIGEIYREADSCHTCWNVQTMTYNGKTAFLVSDYSATAIGYYASKKDYEGLMDQIRGSNIGQAILGWSCGGSDGHCKLYLDPSIVTSIKVNEGE